MNCSRATLTGLLLTSLTACGGGQSTGAGASSSSPVAVVTAPPADSVATPAPAPTPTPTPTPAPAEVVAEAPASSTGDTAGSLPVAVPPAGGTLSPCAGTYAQLSTAGLPDIATKKGGSNGWDERYRGRQLSLLDSTISYCETFDSTVSLAGPVLYAKGHADFGLTKFDAAGGAAYKLGDGKLVLSAYEDAAGKHSGLIQSASSNQAYKAAAFVPNQAGYSCAGCYWEARIKMPSAYGTWASFWLLTPDDPSNKGHLEVDGIEYYGLSDKRGHHHGVHRWLNGKSSGNYGDYTGMDEIADGGWHTYGIDLRGKALLDGKPALVIYLDGKEVGRLAADADYFTSPFYYVANLAMSKSAAQTTFPQSMEIDYITAWKKR